MHSNDSYVGSLAVGHRAKWELDLTAALVRHGDSQHSL